MADNGYKCPDCSGILLKCFIKDIHIKDLIMLCNKSDCDCYYNKKNPHYALIPFCKICEFIFYNIKLQDCMLNSYHCTNNDCSQTYIKNKNKTFSLLSNDNYEKYLIKKYT